MHWATAVLVLVCVVVAPATASLTFTNAPVSCNFHDAGWINWIRCDYLYDAPVTEADVGTDFPAGRSRTLSSIDGMSGDVRYIFETDQTFNTVCFQQPPTEQSGWGATLRRHIGTLEVFAGDADVATATPSSIVAVSATASLVCYPLSERLVTRIVTFRLTLTADSDGFPGGSTLVLAEDSAWDAAPKAALRIPRYDTWTETYPVDRSDVAELFYPTSCTPTASWSSDDSSCSMAINNRPAIADVNTPYTRGLAPSWAARGGSPVAVVTLALSATQNINGLCFQQRNTRAPEMLDRAGRIDVFDGALTLSQMAATSPIATIIIPKGTGRELLCYRLPTPSNASVFASVTTSAVSLRVWKAWNSRAVFGAGTLLPARLRTPAFASPDIAPTSLTFADTPVSCSIIRGGFDSSARCDTMYDGGVTPADVGTVLAHTTSGYDWLYPGHVRYAYTAPQTFNTLCFQQPATSSNAAAPSTVSTIELWASAHPRGAPLATVAMANTNQLRCYALAASATSQAATFKLWMENSWEPGSTPPTGAATLVLARDPNWTPATNAPSPSHVAALAPSMPLARSQVQSLHRVVSCSPSTGLGNMQCGGALDSSATVANVNTAYESGLAPQWAAPQAVWSPLQLTMAQVSRVDALCFQQRNERSPDNLDWTDRIDVWSGSLSNAEMETVPPAATIRIPRATGRELLCYALVGRTTEAPVSIEATQLSLRVWRAENSWGSYGAGTIAPAQLWTGEAPPPPPPGVATPVPPAGVPSPVPPPPSAPSSAGGSTSSSNDDTAVQSADGSGLSSTAVVVIAVAVCVVVIVAIVGVVIAVVFGAKKGQSNPPEPVAVEGVAVEGRPVLNADGSWVYDNKDRDAAEPKPVEMMSQPRPDADAY